MPTAPPTSSQRARPRQAGLLRRRFLALLIGSSVFAGLLLLPLWESVTASNVVPKVIKQPGSQPGEASLNNSHCETCHAGYASVYEPGFLWRGSMMSHAARDPLFYAELAVAEQDFMPNQTVWNNWEPSSPPGTTPPGGVGDLCMRCHTPDGWMGGRSTPTDGSGLSGADEADGVSCDSCHRMMDPGSAEGRRQTSPGHENYRLASPGVLEGFYGSGQYVLDPGASKRGPFDDATSTNHGSIASPFHRSGEMCGTCHDVSNPAVGQLAPGHGRLDGAPLAVNFCLITKAPCTDSASCPDCNLGQISCETTCGGVWSAATSSCDRRDSCRTTVAEAHPPYAYGVMDRTYSEWKSSAWPGLLTGTFLVDPTVPADLKVVGGAPAEAATNAPYSSSTNPVFNPPRTFTCQSCHMHSATGQGCNKNPEVRSDLPLHDLTGGSTWMPAVITDMSAAGTLVGGALNSTAINQLNAGVSRARAQLRMSVKVDPLTSGPGGLQVRVTNLTGHKFPSGFPVGRRAWINVRWSDAAGRVIHEDGAWDPVSGGVDEEGTRVYAARPGMSRVWAQTLLAVGYDSAMALSYDLSGNVLSTLGQLASGALGERVPTFHSVLNDVMVDDDRIPPYGFDPVEAAQRNALPVPAGAYPTLPSGKLQHWGDTLFPVPIGAARADVQVYYQSASPELINFLRRANATNNRGQDLYQAWLNTGKAPPEPMLVLAGSPAPAPWTGPPCSGVPGSVGSTLVLTPGNPTVQTLLSWQSVPNATGYLLHRWSAPDRSGTDSARHLALPGAIENEIPHTGECWFYEIGSTNACGEKSDGGSPPSPITVDYFWPGEAPHYRGALRTPTWIDVPIAAGGNHVLIHSLRILTGARDWGFKICGSKTQPETCGYAVERGLSAGWKLWYADSQAEIDYRDLDGDASPAIHFFVTPYDGDWMSFRAQMKVEGKP